MNIKKVDKGIHMLTMDIENMLFEGMWELPHGVSLNSYVVKGEKIAVIDGFIGWDGIPETLYQGFSEIGIDPKDIDYLVVNHMEPDHSGWIENFKKINDHFQILISKKGAPLIDAFYGDQVDIHIVEDGDLIDLGAGKTLSFHMIPNVHWPETMMTFEAETKALFTCDLFGAFGTLSDHCFDDELTETEKILFEHEGVRYYSNVLTTFSTMADRAVAKAENLKPKIIAPGHGVVYRTRPATIIADYKRYGQYAKGKGKAQVALLWGSMYGMTEQAVVLVREQLEKAGIAFRDLRMPKVSKTDMMTDIFQSAAIIIATPTYEYKMFPPVANALDELGRKKVTGKLAFRLGSYGWSGGAEKELKDLMETYRMNWEFIETVEFAGKPKAKDMQNITAAIHSLIERMKERVVE